MVMFGEIALDRLRGEKIAFQACFVPLFFIVACSLEIALLYRLMGECGKSTYNKSSGLK